MGASSQTPLPAAEGADDLTGLDDPFLLEVGEILRLAGSPPQLLFDVASHLAEHLGASRCLFSEIDRDRATVHRDYHRGLPSLAGSLPLAAYSQENVAALRAGKLVVVSDTAVDPRTADQFEREYRTIGIRASVAVPLFREGQWAATLAVTSHQPRSWRRREVVLIQSVGERTWMTVEHLRALEALRQSEARSASILAAAFDAILSMDHRGRIVEFNPAAERMFGMPRDEALGRSVVEFVVLPGWARPSIGPSFPFGGEGGGALVGKLIQVPAVRADGASFPAEIAISTVAGVTPPLFTATLRDVSQRLRSAEQFRQAVEASPTGMMMADGGGRIVLVNAQVERLFGYERGELIGRPVEVVLPPVDEDPLARRRERIGLHKDGSPVAVQVELTPMPSSEGAFTLSSIADVSERRRLEAEREELVSELRELSRGLEERIAQRTQELAIAHRTLTRSEANFRAVIENAPDAILVHRWGPIVYVNPGFSRTLGYHDREELIGWSIVELVHPDDRERIRGRIRDLRESGVSDRHQARLIHADGSERWVEAAGIPIEFDGSAAVLLMFRDVTERLQVENVLRESEARYRALFDDSPIPLWEEDFSDVAAYLAELAASGVTDLGAHLRDHPEVVAMAASRARILAVNQSALDLYEAESAAELLVGLPQIFGADVSDAFRQTLLAFLDGKTTFEAETVTRTLTGKRAHISFRLNVLSGHEEKWSRVVISIFDLSRHKQAESQIRSSLREKEVLLKEVHHRVKNNLQVISSLLNLQAQHLDDPAAQAMLAESQARVRSIAMVHEKLYQSHDLAHVPFDEYVSELVGDLFHSFDGAGRSIASVIEVDDVQLAVTTAIPCGLIVNELVTNSLKHAFPGGRTGTVRIALGSREDGRLELVVQDDGIGLPADVDPRRTSSLGLELVTMFGEQIEAEVEVRRSAGTRFSFVFPSPGGPT